MKTNTFICMVSLLLLFGCKGYKHSNSYDLTLECDICRNICHVIGQEYSTEEGFSIIHLQTNNFVYPSLEHMSLTVNGETSGFQITPTKLLYDKDGAQSGILYDVRYYDNKPAGKLTVEGTECIDCIEVNLKKGNPMKFYNCIALQQGCILTHPDMEPTDVETIVNALKLSYHFDVDWPIAEKNLLLYTCESEKGRDYSFNGLEGYRVSSSNDGKLTLFTTWYDTGGNGMGSSSEINFARYQADEQTYAIPDFCAWIASEADHIGWNYPYLAAQSTYSIQTSSGTIYLAEMDFTDMLPVFDYDQHSIDNYCFLGAFRIEGESLVPANIFKTANGNIQNILVNSEGKLPRFQVNVAQKRIGVPLIPSKSFKFNGHYLEYVWNEKECAFVYSNRK